MVTIFDEDKLYAQVYYNLTNKAKAGGKKKKKDVILLAKSEVSYCSIENRSFAWMVPVNVAWPLSLAIGSESGFDHFWHLTLKNPGMEQWVIPFLAG